MPCLQKHEKSNQNALGKTQAKGSKLLLPKFFSKSLPGNTDCEILLIKTESADQFIAFRFALNKDAEVKIHT